MRKAAIFLLGLLIGSTVVMAATTAFKDVPASAWYAGAVSRMVDKGVIQGFSDNTFRPMQNVTRAELAVMMDRYATYLETGKVSATPPSNEVAFDGCGKLTSYQSKPWFSALNKKYSDQFLIPDGHPAGTVGGEYGEGCLSLDGNLFIFIPEYSEFGCGIIFSYNAVSGELATPNEMGPHYCASSFGSRVDNYITFVGSEGDGGTTHTYNGKYYFLENIMTATKTTK